jgi:hypothetical protein
MRAANAFTFDASTHTYRIDGRVVPSVTQVIRSIIPGHQADEWYLNRGTAIHYGCELYDKGTLDMDSVDPLIKKQIEAWAKFRQDFPHPIKEIELPMAHSPFGYAGKVDRIFDAKDSWVITDIKSSYEPQAIPQLGAYSLMWSLASPQLRKHTGVIVEVRDDGTYKCHWITVQEMRRAEKTFASLLTVFNFAKEHKLALTPVVQVPTGPLGRYSGKQQALAAVKAGSTVAIPVPGQPSTQRTETS